MLSDADHARIRSDYAQVTWPVRWLMLLLRFVMRRSAGSELVACRWLLEYAVAGFAMACKADGLHPLRVAEHIDYVTGRTYEELERMGLARWHKDEEGS